ncbi:hypothetical protein M595_5486 [Lyngbya aestuarii BL J]|uniref:Three-Cys-motif partner protein TcmP n=1 Tax=Lyngbya aestuarii BL J TaxID=1348334 RepID=U7Q9S1_9CYAN|nr:three-Cys-motif partner protein TcmP [Lyngbya aestuarii]ERT04563.1 hypothetical protein M595_5486 [Lyngbya aestuarii BL J]
MEKQTFGGDWTEEKLNRVSKYLKAYSTIMNKYNFNYAYIDAFAGTGYRTLKDEDEPNTLLLPELVEQESKKFLDGSARIALQIKPEFKKYIFIEKDEKKVNELEKLKIDFPNLSERISIVHSDANFYLKDLCRKDWKTRRAVLFLDPFGMQIPWETIELIAQTKAIDLWYLFPLGIAINRLLTKDGNISESRKARLNEVFGTTGWYDTFYRNTEHTNLFGDTYSTTEKIANCESIGQYFTERLKIIFEGVAKNPLVLCNSRNTPLYLLCFAAGNKKGASTAIKIAQDILKK